jgi:hypothetical protein
VNLSLSCRRNSLRRRSSSIAVCAAGLVVFIIGLYVFPGAMVIANTAGNTTSMEGWFRVLDYNGTVKYSSSKGLYSEPFSTEEFPLATAYNGSSTATKNYTFNLGGRAESLSVRVYFGEGTLWGAVTQDYAMNLTLSFENKTIFYADNAGEMPFTIGSGMPNYWEVSCMIELNSSGLYAANPGWVWLRTISPGLGINGTFVDNSKKLAAGDYLFSVHFSSQDTFSGGSNDVSTSIYDVRTEISINETGFAGALNVPILALPGISVAGAGLTYLLINVAEKRAKLKPNLSLSRRDSSK